MDLGKTYRYLDETRSRKNRHKTIPNPTNDHKKIILCFQIKNSIFSWKDQLDAIQVSLEVISNIKIMNMQLQILVKSEMWILSFPAQASASTENKPAHYLWRDIQIQLPKSLRPLVQFINMQVNILLLRMLPFSAQASASTQSNPAHHLWRDTQKLCFYLLVHIHVDFVLPSTGKC